MRLVVFAVLATSACCTTKQQSFDRAVKSAEKCADYLNDEYGAPPTVLVAECLKHNHNLDLVRLAIHDAERIYTNPTQEQIIGALAVLLADIDEVRFQEQQDPKYYLDTAYRIFVQHVFEKVVP